MARPSKRKFELQSYQINYIKKKLGISKIEDIDNAVLKQLKENLKKVNFHNKKSIISM